ncbi:hypothetical protein QTP88_004579 [Uroleucon formosanum]
MELENHLKNTSSKATYIIIRYINEDYTVHEEFLGFIDPHSYNFENSEIEPKLNGKILRETVLKLMNNFNLDLNNCVGIATDGCSVMASKVCDAVKTILEKTPSAVRCPCFNHGLNLTISKGCQIYSKRNVILQSVLHSSLQSLCETRWVERQTAVTNWNDQESSSKAKVLLNSIDCEFVITFCFTYIFNYTTLKRNYAKKKNFDKQSAVNYINKTIEILNKLRLDGKTEFKDVDNDMITDMKSRFTEQTFGVYNLGIFVPKILISKIQENTFLNIHGLNGRFANREAFTGKLQGDIIWWKEY